MGGVERFEEEEEEEKDKKSNRRPMFLSDSTMGKKNRCPQKWVFWF